MELRRRRTGDSAAVVGTEVVGHVGLSHAGLDVRRGLVDEVERAGR